MAGEDADWLVLVAVSEPPKLKPQDALPATKHGKQWGSCHRGTLVAPSLARLGPRNVAALCGRILPATSPAPTSPHFSQLQAM